MKILKDGMLKVGSLVGVLEWASTAALSSTGSDQLFLGTPFSASPWGFKER